jgi:glycosyltransferase involved in cell wall biosynthesis
MTPHRVVILHYTPPGVIGGVEHVIDQHIGLLSAHGYEVLLVAGRIAPGRDVVVIPEIDAAGQESTAVDVELAAGVVSPRFHEERRAILHRLRPLFESADTVIVHNAFTLHFSLPLTAVLWELSGLRPNGTVIAWSHDVSWVNPLYVSQMHEGYPWSLLKLPAPGVEYVTVSHERRQELQRLWGAHLAPITVVPNGIDAGTFLRLSPGTLAFVERHRLFERDVVLVLPVRITRRKNIQLGIRVVRALRDRGLDVKFIVSGPTAPHHPGRSLGYLHALKTLRKELGVEAEVVFLADEQGDNPDDRAIYELYCVADALLFPSASEGFGLPILEAGLARVPAIVSDIPIFGEVGGPDVWAFDLEERADRIASQVVRALKNPSSRLYRRVLREYRWDVIVQRQLIPLLERSGTSHRNPQGEVARAGS